MSLLFILCFNAFSNVHIDANEDTIRLDWYSDRIVYYNGEKDNSISDNYLNITIDVSEKFYLYIDILESRQCNLQINLTSQNEISYATIFINSELETINVFKKLTVYSNVPISFQNPKYIKFFFQSFNKDGLLTNNYFPYYKGDKTMICYMSDKCASLTTIQTNVIYYSFLNKSTPYYEQNNYMENITIYFDNDHSDVPYFFARSDESMNSIYLVGLKESPSQISFEYSDNTNRIEFLFIQNIQFTKCHTESQISIFDCYINDTYDVFPSNCNLSIINGYENRKNTYQSPFENNNVEVLNDNYNAYLELEKNGDLIFQIVNKSFNILKNKKELIITIPLIREGYIPYLQFDDQKNPNNNTITMDIVDNLDDIMFYFLNCDQIPFEFSDNCNFVNSSLEIVFYTSNKNDILMKPPNNENISIKIYAHQNILNEAYFIYPITGYTICTTPDGCEDPCSEMKNKKYIETIDDLYNFLDTYQNITAITLILNSNYNEKEFDLAPHLSDRFGSLNIYYFDSSNPISITLKSLKNDIYLEITNCNVNISNDFQPYEIKLYDNSTITNNLQTEKYCNVDIRSDDAILKLYEDFYEIGNFVYNYDTTLILKANSLNHYLKIEFDANVKEAKINIFTEYSLSYIPIDIKEDYENDETKRLEIKLSFENEDDYMPSNVIYKSLPKRTYVFIYYDYTLGDQYIYISKIYPEGIADGIFFAYTDPYYMRYCDIGELNGYYFFLVKNDEEFEKIMKFTESITGKASMLLKIYFFFEFNEHKIKFQCIPKHIQLIVFIKRYNFNNDRNYLNLLLADDVDVSSLNGVLFFNEYIKFKVDPNANKIFEFNDILLTYPIFNYYDLDKIKIKTASTCISVTSNGYLPLKDITYYDLSAFFDKYKVVLLNNDNYSESIYITFENDTVVLGITPQEKNLIFKYIDELADKFLFVSNLTNKNNIVFNIKDQTINQTNFAIDNESYMVDLNFTCGNGQNSNFMINLYVNKLIEDNVTINEENCNDFIVKNVILYPLIILPTKEFSLSEEFSLSNPFTKSYDFTHSNHFTDNPTEEVIVPTQEYVPPLRVENKNTTSNFIEITNNGYITKEENEDESEKSFDEDPTSIKTITLLLNEVTISENNTGSTPGNTLYLIASLEGTKITIKSSVNKSNVGILSDNSPTIVIEKSRNSVNLMNSGNEKENYITIDFETIQEDDQEVTKLYFKDVENRNGEFSVIVPSNIDIISFMNLVMSRKSTFGVKKNGENKRNIHKLDENEEFVNVQIENSIKVDSQSIANISNVNLIGTLNIYDDSSLTMNEKSNFSEKSEINVVIQQSKSYTFDDKPKPIIYVEKSLNSIPKAIILMSDPNNKIIDISNMPIIASETFDLCSNLCGLVKFQDGKDGDISAKCENHNDMEFLLLSAKEKDGKKNKLGADAIAGIVIGCVAAVAIIAIVVIILIRRKRNNFSNDEDENNSEVSELWV